MIKKLSLLIRGVQDKRAEENFRKIEQYINNVVANTLKELINRPIPSPVKSTYENYELIDLSTHPLRGDYTGGKLAVSRVGKTVTITMVESPTYPSGIAGAKNSLPGLIPKWARPTISNHNIFVIRGLEAIRVQVGNQGVYEIVVYNPSFASVDAPIGPRTGSITYLVEE